MQQSPIFARTHDLVLWLLARSESFPRSQRFVLTKRLQDTALDFQEKLVEASLGRKNDLALRLVEADVELGKLRFYLRLCHELTWLSTGSTATPRAWWPRSAGSWAAGRKKPPNPSARRGEVSSPHCGDRPQGPGCCVAVRGTTVPGLPPGSQGQAGAGSFREQTLRVFRRSSGPHPWGLATSFYWSVARPVLDIPVCCAERL